MPAMSCAPSPAKERPAVVLKEWEEHDLLEAVNPVLAKKTSGFTTPSNRLMKVREDLFTAGFPSTPRSFRCF